MDDTNDYALMVEELTGQAIEEIVALVGVEGHNAEFQIFMGIHWTTLTS